MTWGREVTFESWGSEDLVIGAYECRRFKSMDSDFNTSGMFAVDFAQRKL